MNQTLQRKCGCGGTCGTCGKKQQLRRKPLDGSQSREYAPITIPAVRSVAGQDLSRVPAHATPIFSKAQSEHGVPLDPRVRGLVEGASGADLDHVRLHTGPASAAAAHFLGARAFTVGSDIHMGRAPVPSGERERLLTHEAAHVVQQGGRTASVTPSMRVSSPQDAGEREAHGFTTGSLVVRESPHVQRDLNDTHTVNDGSWRLKLLTVSDPGGKSGLQGTIQFWPDEDAPDSTHIRLAQSVRVQNLPRGTDHTYTGDRADLNKMRTRKNKRQGIVGGFFIDHDPDLVEPRQNESDRDVVPYYRKYAKNERLSQDGSKSGPTIEHASLFDFPGANVNSRFTFETVATAADTGYHYASLTWGFQVTDADAGTVENEHSSARRSPTKTFHAALRAFNEFYKNPGASTAP